MIMFVSCGVQVQNIQTQNSIIQNGGDRTDLFDDKYQIFQWLLWIASKRQFPFHAKELTEYALKNWYNWE